MKNEYGIPGKSTQGLTEDEVRSLVDSMLQNYQNSIRVLSGNVKTIALQLTDLSATPANGTWQRGTVVSVAGIAYICTVSGSPGTWTKIGTQS